MNRYVFEVTTDSPQFVGQAPQADLTGRAFFRQRTASLTDARLACEGQPKARIWAFVPGVKTGGEMLLSRGYV